MRRFYQQHNCRRAAVIDTRLDEMATAQPLTTDPAIVDTPSLAVQSYAAQLRPLLEAIDTFEAQIATVFAAHPGPRVVREFPRRRGGLRPTPGGRLRHRPHPLGRGDRAPVTRGYRAGHGTQRQSPLGPSSPGLSEVPQADVSRICGPIDPFLRLGTPLLRFNSEAGATTIMPPCDRSPSNGCGFSFAAGRTGPHTTKPSISTRYADTGRHSLRILLDGTTQMSMPPRAEGGGHVGVAESGADFECHTELRGALAPSI